MLGYAGRMFHGAPQPPEVPISDIVGGSQAALAIVAALFARELTGEGEWIDFSITDGLLHSWVAMGLNIREGHPDSDEANAVAGIMSGYAVFHLRPPTHRDRRGDASVLARLLRRTRPT